jgi:hypothetical protein
MSVTVGTIPFTSIGPSGPKGVTGPTGPIGTTGTTGATGPFGYTGTFTPYGMNYGEYLYYNSFINNFQIGSSNIFLGKDAGIQNFPLFLSPTIAIGQEAGNLGQNPNAIAIGYQAQPIQSEYAITIGTYSLAPFPNQRQNCIAIGSNTNNGDFNQSIVLNASSNLLSSSSNGLYVSPIRTNVGNTNCYQMYYDKTNSEIRYYQQVPGSVTFDTDGSVVLPTNVTKAYITAVGGGGGGSGGTTTNSGGGGGSGGAVYKYPINYVPSTAIVVKIGLGGPGGAASNAGASGGETTITYNINVSQTITLRCGGGGGGGTTNLYYAGAGGSVSFLSIDKVTPDPINYTPTASNTTSPYTAAVGTNNSNGSSGKLVIPIILGSSGGAGRSNPGVGYNGGSCLGFYTGGSGGPASTIGSGGGAGSIFAKGADGTSDVGLIGSLGSGGSGGGTNGITARSGRPGGDGRVLIEW